MWLTRTGLRKRRKNPDKSNFKNIVFVIKKLSRAYAHGFHFKDEVFSCLSMMLKNMQLPRGDSDRTFFLDVTLERVSVTPSKPSDTIESVTRDAFKATSGSVFKFSVIC